MLLSLTADFGRTAVVPYELEGAYINQHLAILRVKEEVVPLYLAGFLASPDGERQVKRLNREGVKAGLNFDDIRSIQVPIPSRATQQRFATFVGSIRRLESHLQSATIRADELLRTVVDENFGSEHQ